MKKEELKCVEKAWGFELIIVNCAEYCGKLLFLRKSATSSYHVHRKKKETFFCLDGQVGLTVEMVDHMLNPTPGPKPLSPGSTTASRD